MPICEEDPWRSQYFSKVDCPQDLFIPTDDADAWLWNPEHRWVYDRLAIAQMQEITSAPHGVMPTAFPVFSKPIVNLQGMGVGIRFLKSREQYERRLVAGHFWMEVLFGVHVSSDVAVQQGRAVWWRHAIGTSGADVGTFSRWSISAGSNAVIESRWGRWIAEHLNGYTGMVNLETIGGRLIETHLRLSAQWPDLYGPGWVEAVVQLYASGEWHYPKELRREGYSVPLFLPHANTYRHPSLSFLDMLRNHPDISSIQLTFHEGSEQHLNPMPPGGFRAAVVNCYNVEAGVAARDMLRRMLISGTG
jgi:hypothetical protein